MTSRVARARLQIRLEGFAPEGISRADALIFWQGAAVIALGIKRDELRRGLDASGSPLAALKPSTIRHRRSAMGTADPHAPPLIPAWDLSRTIAWLRARSDATGCTLYWAGREGKYSWARILGFHARIGGYVRGAPVRDVIGLSQPGEAAVIHQAHAWWSTLKGASVPGPRVIFRLHPAPAGRLPGAPQKPGPTRLNVSNFERVDLSHGFTAGVGARSTLPGVQSTGYGQFARGSIGQDFRSALGKAPSPTPRPGRPPAPQSRPSSPAIEARREIREAIKEQARSPVTGATIRDRLAAYKVGDAKLKAVAAVAGQAEAKIARLTARIDALASEAREILGDAALPEQEIAVKHQAIMGKLLPLRDRVAGLEATRRRRVFAALAVDSPVKIAPKAARVAEGAHRAKKPGKALAKRVEEAFAIVCAITTGPAPVEVEYGQLHANKPQRSYQLAGRLYMGDGADMEVVAHELMHTLETSIRTGTGASIGSLGIEFRELRAKGEAPAKLKDVTGIDYAEWEIAVKDAFDRALPAQRGWYAGKIYQFPDHSEVLSMGIEQLLRDPVGFCAKDPEWAKLIIGVLDGSLR